MLLQHQGKFKKFEPECDNSQFAYIKLALSTELEWLGYSVSRK